MKCRTAITSLALVFLLQAQDAGRSKASDYPAHVSLPTADLGVEYLVHTIPGERGGYFAKEYLVVEVAVFPSSQTGLKISSALFTLRINNKTVLSAQSAGAVAAALKYPDWEQRRNVTAQAGPVIIGAPPQVGRFPGDPTQQRPLPGPVPDQTNNSGIEQEQNRPIEEAIALAALPQGPITRPVKGCLFFRFEGKLKSIKSLELMYDSGGGAAPAKIPLL